MREKDSVSIYFVQLIVHGLRDQPLRLQSVLQAAEIDMALLDDPTARVSASAFAALWLIQIKELGDEFFGLDSHGMPLGSFALICRGLDSGTRSGEGPAPMPEQFRPVPARLSRQPHRPRLARRARGGRHDRRPGPAALR